MSAYFLGFLISGLGGYGFSKMLLGVYEWNRTYQRVQLEEHVKWHIRRAIRKTSVGAGIVAGAIWAVLYPIF